MSTNRKLISILLACILLLASVFALAGCNEDVETITKTQWKDAGVSGRFDARVKGKLVLSKYEQGVVSMKWNNSDEKSLDRAIEWLKEEGFTKLDGLDASKNKVSNYVTYTATKTVSNKTIVGSVTFFTADVTLGEEKFVKNDLIFTIYPDNNGGSGGGSGGGEGGGSGGGEGGGITAITNSQWQEFGISGGFNVSVAGTLALSEYAFGEIYMKWSNSNQSSLDSVIAWLQSQGYTQYEGETAVKDTLSGLIGYTATKTVGTEVMEANASFITSSFTVENMSFDANDLCLSFYPYEGSGGSGGGEGGGEGGADWLTSDELNDFNATGFALPAGMTVTSKETTPGDDFYGWDKKIDLILGQPTQANMRLLAQAAFNVGFNKGYDETQYAAYDNENLFIDYSSADYEHLEFAAYKFGTNWNVECSIILIGETLTLSLEYYDTAPEAVRNTWLTSEERGLLGIDIDLPQPTFGTLTETGTFLSYISYGYGHIDIYFTGVTEAQFLQYAEQVIYTQLGANKDEFDLSDIATFEINYYNNYDNDIGFIGVYKYIAGDKQYVAQVTFYKEATTTTVGSKYTYEVEANSMIIKFSIVSISD